MKRFMASSRSQHAVTAPQPGSGVLQLEPVTVCVDKATATHGFDDVVKDLEQHVKPHVLALDTSKSVARKIVQHLTDKHNLSGAVNTTAFAQGDETERTKAISQHAFAVQRAASLFSLQHNLLTDSHNQVLKHIHDTIEFRKTNATIAKTYNELQYTDTFVKPLEQEAEQLKTKAEEADQLHSKATQQFGAIRHVATRPLMMQMRQCTQDYSNHFKLLQQSSLEQLTQVLHDITITSRSTTNQNAESPTATAASASTTKPC